ncbi:NAD(P)-binding domain-containing protein [Streptomyces sp. MP131-18]|uniref:NAD(P)-binding domain-containing protein n=1 Tax=Streptomyces sp. MP131-18 TaxID=1857892 RepID=UPI00097C0DFA|nr:NAD(P)-binding domain-containing protein [Streptomyces sp. MP131-18]ONK16237.1 3-hydroxyisobutyrate dehydrogenase [Streptomyces sp. MP131-18]
MKRTRPTATLPPVQRPPADGVAVLGTGRLGGAIAEALLAAGHPTCVWNRTAARTGPQAEAGARVADSPADAAAGAALLVLCVGDFQAVRQTLSAAGASLAGRTVLVVTTLTPDEARAAAAVAAEHGASYASVPFMAGYQAIGRPEALLLCAGPREVFDRHQETLRALGGDVRHVGDDPGLGALFEAAVVGFLLEFWAGYLHTLALVRRENGPTDAFASVLQSTLQGLAPLLPVIAGQTVSGDYDPETFGRLDYLAPMADAMIGLRRSRGIDTARLEHLKGLIDQRLGLGFGGEGLASLIEVIEGSGDGGAGSVG